MTDWVLTTMKEPEATRRDDALDAGVEVLATFATQGLDKAVALANRASRRILDELADKA